MNISCKLSYNCTVPYFGFKAKRKFDMHRKVEYCTVPYFGFKAKLQNGNSPSRWIVLCLILDSRQNNR